MRSRVVFISILFATLCSCSGSGSKSAGSEPDYPSITDTVRLNRLSVNDEFLKPTRLFVAQNHLVVAHTGISCLFRGSNLELGWRAAQASDPCPTNVFHHGGFQERDDIWH